MDPFIEGQLVSALMETVEPDVDMKQNLLFLFHNSPYPGDYPLPKRRALSDVGNIVFQRTMTEFISSFPPEVIAMAFGDIMFQLGERYGALQERARAALE